MVGTEDFRVCEKKHEQVFEAWHHFSSRFASSDVTNIFHKSDKRKKICSRFHWSM